MDTLHEPPATNRGVEFRIDWLGVTIRAGAEVVCRWALQLLGIDGSREDFEQRPHGGMGYHRLFIHPSGLRVYSEPVYLNQGESTHCHMSMSGSVSSCVSAEVLRLKFQELEVRGYDWSVTRTDLAFDHDQFNPSDIYDAVLAGQVRSGAERRTLQRNQRPLDEDNDTVYLGSRTSERYLRNYLKNGITRTELELKGKRAQAVFCDLLARNPAEWASRAMAHLRDFADFDISGWRDLCAGIERALMVLSRVESSLDKLRAWLWLQVAPSLAVLAEVDGSSTVEALILHGFEQFKGKHRALLSSVEVAQ